MESLKLEDLSVEQKIGQMLLCRRPINDKDREYITQMVSEKKLGGIHMGDPLGVNKPIYEAAEYPLLICDNMEYGFGRKRSAVGDVAPIALAATDSEEDAYEWARLTAIQAKAKGFNVVFGPLFDIAMNPLSSCVGPRTFGGNKELVARMSAAAVKGYQDNGMVVTGKHYPGFGESHVDSHIGMVYLNCNKDLLVERELYPYKKVNEEAGLSAVMVGHIMVPAIDPDYPATVSQKLTDVIRGIGYDGLLMTDSLAMVGMTNMFGLEECHGMAMGAGMDMVMTSYRISAKQAYEYMLKAYEDGKVTDAQIDAAAQRVITAQNRTILQPDQKECTSEEAGFCLNVTRRAVTAILEGADDASIPADGKHLFVVQKRNISEDDAQEGFDLEGRDMSETKKQIKQRFKNADILDMPEFPSRSQMENALKLTMNYNSIVIVLYNKSVAYMGSSDMTRRMLAFMEGVSHKTSAVILYGNPYAAREFPKVPRVILAYETDTADQVAFEVLSGETFPKGTCPVPLEK